MKAVVYQGPNLPIKWTEVPKPTLQKPTDALLKMVKTTICGTDLHILKGDVPAVTKGRVLGHEGVGIVEEVGSSVTGFKKGDKVLISAVSACGSCEYCKKGVYAHCQNGGSWILGHLIDGTQAEYVRIPFADNSLYIIPEGVDDEAVVMLSDILPTGFEIGVTMGAVKPGDSVAIVGSGPIGMATLLTAQFYTPSAIIMIDLDEERLASAKNLGATHTINSNGKNIENIKTEIAKITGKDGVDVSIEAVGIPATFNICQSILVPGGRLANVGVHGKPVSLEIQNLWIRNVTITTGLVSTNTTPQLLKALTANKLQASKLITHHFKMDEFEKAYEVFGQAAKHKALKVIISA